MKTDYTPIIGMEVHVELGTTRKMFCDCSAEHFQVEPNTHVCPVCMGLPGAMPVPNAKAIQDMVKIGMALGCKVNMVSKFDRKHYFYPDLPKAYQISQYDQPFCYGGSVTLSSGKKVRITRVHLEEDTGKLSHRKVAGRDVSLVDYNRSGVPLVEIVTEPDLQSSEETKEYLKLIHATVRYLGVSDADMEKGSMRLEANISVTKDGQMPAYKVEVKNVNSFRYIAAAIDFEVERHIEMLEDGMTPKQETRGWSLEGRKTVSQRTKEEAKDYRYFPEPDIPPIQLSKEQVEKWRDEIGVTPMSLREELRGLGVRDDYIQIVISEKQLALKIIELVKVATAKKLDLNKVVGSVVNNSEASFEIDEVVKTFVAKSEKVYASEAAVRKWIDEAIAANPQVVEDYRKGKEIAAKFFVGQVMKLSRGQADPSSLEKMIIEALKK